MEPRAVRRSTNQFLDAPQQFWQWCTFGDGRPSGYLSTNRFGLLRRQQSRQEQELYVARRRVIRQLRSKVAAVKLWHIDITDDEIGLLGLRQRKRPCRYVRRHDVILCADLRLQVGGDGFIVVDHQDLLARSHGLSTLLSVTRWSCARLRRELRSGARYHAQALRFHGFPALSAPFAGAYSMVTRSRCARNPVTRSSRSRCSPSCASCSIARHCAAAHANP